HAGHEGARPDHRNHHEPDVPELASRVATDRPAKLVRNYLAAVLACGFLFADTGRIAEAVREAGDDYRQGKHAEAEKATAEALSLIDGRRGSPDFEVAECLNTIGALVYSLGDLDRAEQLFQRSRQGYAALVGQDDPRL